MGNNAEGVLMFDVIGDAALVAYLATYGVSMIPVEIVESSATSTRAFHKQLALLQGGPGTRKVKWDVGDTRNPTHPSISFHVVAPMVAPDQVTRDLATKYGLDGEGGCIF
jgi:hypothetical protein